MDINKFYEKVAESLDVEVTDGYLKIKSGEKSVKLTHNGVPLVLPTNEHVRSLLDEDEDGNIVTVKHLFNPLDETVISGDSVSLRKLKKLAEVVLGNRLAVTGTLLLKVGENQAHQTKSTMLINQFLGRLSEAKNPGIKQLIDDKTIDKWVKLYSESQSTGKTKFLKVFVKKGGKLDGSKYNRTATYKYPIYEELLNMEKNGRINGVTLRNKDITIFKIIFEYLVEGLAGNTSVAVGSNDGTAPGFVSLMTMYVKIMNRIQTVLGDIKGVDAEWEDSGKLTLSLTEGDVSDISPYKNALTKIPRDTDKVKTKLATVAIQPAAINTPTPQPNYGQLAQQQQPITQVSQDPTKDALKKALYGGVTGINTPVIQPYVSQGMPPQQQPAQQPMGYPQQQPMQQPMGYPQQQPMQQPMGYPQQQPMQQPAVTGIAGNYNQPSIGSLGTTTAFGGGVQQNTTTQWGR